MRWPRAAATPPGAADDLDGTVRRLDPDRWLASRFIADKGARADVVALYAFDSELERIGRLASNPLVAEIRLCWWRERLEELADRGTPATHPILTALAGAMARRQWERTALARLIEARMAALSGPAHDPPSALAWADATTGAMTFMAARALDPAVPEGPLASAGRAWGLLLLRRSAGVSATLIDPLLKRAFAEAAAAAGRIGPAAFPAMAFVTLVRAALGRSEASALERRLRLTVAVALGRI